MDDEVLIRNVRHGVRYRLRAGEPWHDADTRTEAEYEVYCLHLDEKDEDAERSSRP